MRRRAHGFTLLEIMVALGIFVIAVSSIMSLFLVAASTHKRSVDNQRAAMLAESVLSEYEAQVKIGKVMERVKDKQHPDFPGLSYDVVIEPIDSFEANVKVVVKWKREGKTRTHEFETVILGRTGK